MSDETSAAIKAVRTDWVSKHKHMYLSSGGTEGHIMDVTAVGGPALGTHCMIRFKGRKSGDTLITPLCYSLVNGEVTICASKGGSDHHPAWYLNLIADPRIDFQIGTQAWRGTWREPEGAERDHAWASMSGNFHFYSNYQASTSRILPLVMMQAVEPISVFSPRDIGL